MNCDLCCRMATLFILSVIYRSVTVVTICGILLCWRKQCASIKKLTGSMEQEIESLKAVIAAKDAELISLKQKLKCDVSVACLKVVLAVSLVKRGIIILSLISGLTCYKKTDMSAGTIIYINSPSIIILCIVVNRYTD